MLRFLIRSLVHSWKIRRDAVGYARSIGVEVGERCWFIIDRGTFGSEPGLVKIGDHVLITAGVRFITHDGGVWIFREKHPELDVVAPIVVGDNVFIGLNSIIMPGVKIGNHCVIAAGSVVTRDVPDNTLVGGVPARQIQTIDEYWAKMQAKAVPTGQMGPIEKWQYLKRHFNLP